MSEAPGIPAMADTDGSNDAPRIATEAHATAAKPVKTTSVRKGVLKGHAKDVTFLSTNRNGSSVSTLLASASEDSTVRIWDIAAALPRSVRQISDVFAGEVVTSVDFGPTLLYATTESSLFAFDLRKTNEVLLKQSKFQKSGLAEEELSQVSACPSDPRYVAVCDDSGRISVINVSKSHMPIVMTWQHHMMCGGIQFHPSNKDRFVSAGLMERDLRLWSLTKRSSIATKKILSGEELAHEYAALNGFDETHGGGAEGPGQMFNPPLVQSLHFSPDGKYVATGGGDGSCHLFSHAQKLKPLFSFPAHRAPVCQVHFAAWGRWDSNAGSQENAADLPAKASAAPAPKTAAKKSKGKKGRKKGRKQKRGNGNSNIVGLGANSDEDVTLVTASNDCSIRFWKLQPRAAAAQVEANKKKQTEQSARTEDADATPAETERPCKCELRVKHPRPINWIASTVAQDGGRRIFVADVSSDISFYTLP